MIGKLGSEFVHNLERFWLETCDRVARTGNAERVENYNEATGRWYNVHVSRVSGHDRRVAVVFDDVSERKRAEAARRESEARQAFLLELSDALRACPDEQSIKQQSVAMLAEHLRLDRCWISEVFDEQGISTVGPEHVRDELAPMRGVFRLADYPETMRQLATQPMVLRDSANDPRFSSAERELLAGLQLGALLVAPLREGSRHVIWAFAAATVTPRQWTDGDRMLLEDVAERTWAAVERARAEGALRQAHDLLEQRVRERTSQVQSLFGRLVASQEDERRRIARDIHDQVGQQMTALRMNLEALRSQAEGRTALAEQADRTQRLAEELDQSIDFLTWQLRPAALDHLGLSAALQNLVTGWAERFAIAADFAVDGVEDVRLPRDVEANLYRIAQEALHNVAKHARATQVTAYLTQQGNELVLLVEDNGRGFDAEIRPEDGHMGLMNMRERAALVGGRLDIESVAGHGTSIHVRIPERNGTNDGR